MVSRPFEKWWKRFECRLEDEEPYKTASRLQRKLGRMRVAERPEFLLQLWEVLLQHRHAYGVTLFLLDAVTDLVQLYEMAERLTPLPSLQPPDEEAHLADLIRILAASDVPGLGPPVEAYLLVRPIGPFWATVPWALWPHQKKLFTRAWQRYLRETQPTEWNATLIVKSFLTEPDAVRLVRSAVARQHPEDWEPLRLALIGEADQVGWLSEEQRESLDQAVL